jgi:hypothetical protein
MKLNYILNKIKKQSKAKQHKTEQNRTEEKRKENERNSLVIVIYNQI